MHVQGYNHFGGRHGESAALKNLLAHAGAINPHTGKPFTEALCFGIAGGIGAGYSFCPSVPRHGMGSGISIVGRYHSYATGPSWYQGFCDRLGITTRIRETGGVGKAFQNLAGELEAGRPTVVWCSKARLPFLGNPMESHDMWMHSLVIHAIDMDKGEAHGGDLPPNPVTLSLDALTEARNGVCSHKNRTLTIDVPKSISSEKVASAVRDGIRATTQELLQGRMKTFSLPGLEIWAKMIANDKSKDGWLQVFKNGLMYCALRDVFESIETVGNGGGLFRSMYADFLDEAATLGKNAALRDLSGRYRALSQQWTELAESVLPDKIKPFKLTKELLRKKTRAYEEKGQKVEKQTTELVRKLQQIEGEMRKSFPMGAVETRTLLESVREEIVDLHAAETEAAEALRSAAAA